MALAPISVTRHAEGKREQLRLAAAEVAALVLVAVEVPVVAQLVRPVVRAGASAGMQPWSHCAEDVGVATVGGTQSRPRPRKSMSEVVVGRFRL